MEHDCILELDSDELAHYLETGEEPGDMGKALEEMLKLALANGSAKCIFTVYRSESAK